MENGLNAKFILSNELANDVLSSTNTSVEKLSQIWARVLAGYVFPKMQRTKSIRAAFCRYCKQVCFNCL